MGNCCSNVPDIEANFPAINIVAIDSTGKDPVAQPGPAAEQFEDLNFSDSSSIDEELQHLSKLLTPKKETPKKEPKSEKSKKKVRYI